MRFTAVWGTFVAIYNVFMFFNFQNAFPMAGLYSTHILSLDALITVIDSIEGHCHAKVLRDREALEKPKSQKDNTISECYLLTDFILFIPEFRSSFFIAVNGNTVELSKPLQTPFDTSVTKIQISSGYLLAQDILANDKSLTFENDTMNRDRRRIRIANNVTSHAELINIKHKKKVYELYL